MGPRAIRILAPVMLAVAILAWAGYGGLVWALSAERVAYAQAVESREQNLAREQSETRLQAAVRDTEAERASLESLVRVPIVATVEMIEETGRAAGMREVTVVEATPQTTAAKDLSAVSVVVQSQGTFAAAMRAYALYEAVPLPATIEQVELEKTEEGWNLRVRLRVLLASDSL